ncbi:MAG: histidine phosphatase family protein [Thermoclostridium sp.]|nr:histidine phosphatase family protein [Thermoclostridium sp.]
MLEIMIVRHGQSVADIENRYESRVDFPLTDLGHAQAAKLALWIKLNYPPDFIVSSPLKRASQTAETIGKEVNIEVKYDNDLMELDTGLLAGLLKAEADLKYPRPEGGRKAHEAIHGGESLIEFRARVERFWSKLISEHGNEETESRRILIVSHGGTINMLFRCFLCLPMSDEPSIHTGDTCVHLWKITKSKKEIEFLNYKAHLLQA